MIYALSIFKGGCGKTSTAFNLAHALGVDEVFDLDVNHGFSRLASLRVDALPFPIRTFKNKTELINALIAAGDKTILIDCGGYDSELTRVAIAAADLLITPAIDSPIERIALFDFSADLVRLSKEIKKPLISHLLICRCHPQKKNFPKFDEITAALPNLKRLNTTLAHRPDAVECHAQGRGVTESVATRHTPAAKEIMQLAEELKELISK